MKEFNDFNKLLNDALVDYSGLIIFGLILLLLFYLATSWLTTIVTTWNSIHRPKIEQYYDSEYKYPNYSQRN